MGHRNMPGTSQTIDYQMNQAGQGPLLHGPGLFNSRTVNYPQQHPHVSANASIIDGHHVPEPYNNSLLYGMPPYGAAVHHPVTNLELGVTVAPNFYNPYMTPGAFPAPTTYVPYDHLLYHGVMGIPSDEDARNSFLYGMTTKRKNAEVHGNLPNLNASASSGSTIDADTGRPLESGAAVTNAERFPPSHFMMNIIPSTEEANSLVNIVDRPGAPVLDSVMVHGPAYMVPGGYLGQPFHPAGHVWSDQPHNTNQGDLGIMSWNQLPAAPLLPGVNVSRSARENGAMSVHGYQDMATSSSNFLPQLRHGNLPPPLPPPSVAMHIVGSPNVNFYQQVAAPLYRIPANNTAHGPTPQDGMNSGLRLQGTVLPTGFRIHRPHRATLPDASFRSYNMPDLRYMPQEEVAELVIPENFEEISVDQHRDMRMDIEHMSYEELLALGDHIGNATTGLTAEVIRKYLKTKVHVAPSKNKNSEKPGSEEQEFDSCIICQSDYEEKEKIGTLTCRHEYHADCLEKWLLVKNVCPVCKSSALVVDKNPKV